MTGQDAEALACFPQLKTLDASQCDDYEMLNLFQNLRPDCEVVIQVSLGDKRVDSNAAELTLVEGEYDFDIMMENLQHMTSLQTITFKTPNLTLEQLQQLEQAYESIAFNCTAEILGVEYDTDTTEIDLSMMDSKDVDAVAEKLIQLTAEELQMVNEMIDYMNRQK